MTTSTLKLSVETGQQLTISAEVRNGPGGKWYVSHVTSTHLAMDFPNALRELADELERNLRGEQRAAHAAIWAEIERELQVPKPPPPVDVGGSDLNWRDS